MTGVTQDPFTLASPLILMRHGETVFNLEGRYQGQLDSPLTKRGQDQAEAVAKMLARGFGNRSVRIVTSPLGRARATASILAGHLENSSGTDVDDRLMEVGMGAWDGLTRAEIAERWPEARRGHGPRAWMFHGPGGETLDSFATRSASLLDDLRTALPIARVLVGHAVSGRVLRAIHANRPVSEVLTEDAPQDAAYALLPEGRIEFLPTNAYFERTGA